MKQCNVLKNTRGFVKAYEAALKWRSMHNKTEVIRRVKALQFWDTHGLAAAIDHSGVSKRTLQRWKATLENAGGAVTALDPQSTAPHKRRTRSIPRALETRIIEYRTRYPRLGKKKLTPLLNQEGFTVTEPSVGRYITDLKRRGLLPHTVKLSWYAKSGTHKETKRMKAKKLRRPHKRGVEIDTIVRYIDGTKRYVLTAIDTHKRIAYARVYTTHSSAAARDFLKRLLRHVPFDITEIQTDNGSEFAKHFHGACITLGITHYHTYPRCPKMNAHIERFNRTVSEEFLVYHRALVRDDVDQCNDALECWLHWYNHRRPHESLGLLSPMQYLNTHYQPG